jgi:glycosyltransferase involved in cell wall biosynthesis
MPPVGVNLIGYLFSEKGLGEAARGLARACRAAGVPVAANDFSESESVNRSLDFPVERIGLPFPVTLLAVNPDGLRNFALNVDVRRLRRGRYTIGYWFWEQPEFPADWADRFDTVDEVWVGSTFTQQAVARVSPVPVVRVPPALDPNPSVSPLARAGLGIPADAFVFLFVFDASSTLARKNPVGLIRAFRQAFPADPGVRLVLKVSRLELAPDRADLLAAAAADPRVLLLGGVLPRPGITALLAAADCYVSLHRSEGFGLTMAEAMVLGKPVIATGYSANLDYMTPWNSLLVDYRLARLDRDTGPYRAGQEWAEPSADHAAAVMQAVVRDRGAASRLGARARADVTAALRPEAVGRLVAGRLAALGRPRPPLAGGRWELVPHPRSVPPLPPGGAGTCGLTVRDPFPEPAPPGARLVGVWRTADGRPVPDAVPPATAVGPVADAPGLPIIYVGLPFVAPPRPGEYRLAVDLLDAAGRPLCPPAEVPVRVTP